MTTITLTDQQKQFLRTSLSYLLYAHTPAEAIELDAMAARGWFKKTLTKINRGKLKARAVYSITPSGRRAAEKLLATKEAEGE